MADEEPYEGLGEDALLRILLETEKLADVGGWEWDIAEDVWSFSHNWLRIHGCTKRRLTTAELLPIAHPEDRPDIESAFRWAVENGEPYQIEHRIIRQDTGEIRHVKACGLVKCDDQGRPRKLYGSAQDITERKKAEEVLKASEEKWRTVLMDTPQIAISLDPQGIVTFANTHFLRLTGWLEVEVIGEDWFDLFVPEGVRDEIRRIFFTSIQRKDALEFSTHENEISTKSGDRITIAWSNLINKDVRGEVTDVTCLGVDLTERKRFETALQEKYTDLKLAQRIASIGTWTLDPEIGVPEWSDEVYRIYERDPALGPYGLADYERIYKGVWRERFHEAIKGAIEDGTPYDIELKLELPSGREKWIHAIAEPNPDRGPGGHRVRGTIQDITEKRRGEEALRQSQKMEAVGTLAGGVAHEFNNMLGIILGNAELAIEDVPAWNPAADCLEEIRASSLRARDVVRKLLSVARKSPESRNPIRIREILDESLGLLRKTLPASIDIRSNLACETEMILADPTEIHQVLINLCTNSAHAMADGKGVLEVSLEKACVGPLSAARQRNVRTGDYARLTVADNGKGISAAVLDRIFEPYFTTKDVDEGLGMGLAVVQGIVEKHEGSISIESKVDQGTTAEVLFPLIHEGPAARTGESDGVRLGSGRILFVDDEPTLVKLNLQLLERSGYEVVGCTSSVEALALFQEDPEGFDLVVTDMAMPDMTGDVLAQHILRIRRHTPILLCTGHSDHIDEQEARRLGIRGFVVKPLAWGDLTGKIAEVLDGC